MRQYYNTKKPFIKLLINITIKHVILFNLSDKSKHISLTILKLFVLVFYTFCDTKIFEFGMK